ncbi:MAG: sporulation protein YpjB [Paenibacillaceae bacterium]
MFLGKLKYGFLILLIGCVFTGCTEREQRVSVSAVPTEETVKQIERFSQMSDEVYNKTVQGEFLEARKKISQMSDLLPQMRLEGATTTFGLKALADTLVQAIQVFNAVRLDPEQALFQSARIRLMADALSHPNTPLWLQYNKIMQEDLRVMDQAVKQKKVEEVEPAFTKMKVHYQTIKPALQVSLQEEWLVKLDSAFQFMQTQLQASPLIATNVIDSIKTLHKVIEELFQIKSAATAYLPFMETNEPMLRWFIILTAIIMIALGFVAWRRRATRDDIISIRR